MITNQAKITVEGRIAMDTTNTENKTRPNITKTSAVNRLGGILKDKLPDDTDMRSVKEQRLKEKLEQTDR